MAYLVTYDLLGPKGPTRATEILKGTVARWWAELNEYAKARGYTSVVILNSERMVDDKWSVS